MNRPDSKKRPAKSNRVAGKSAAVVPGGAPSAGAVHMAGAPRGSSSPAAGGSPGACDLPTPRAPTTGGFPIVGGFPVLGASFTGQPSPNSTEWIYPQGGFMNFLQSPKVPFVNYPNGSQQPENFHFVGGPMKYSVNPSPTGSSDAGAAQVGSQVTETIDCMHWHWERCPIGWKGMYTRGDQGVPTVILEAVASHDRWIWHAFFGVPGSNNDINVLNQSHLFVQQLRGEGPQVQYYVNGRQYNNGYYLADGIYPEWAAFVKSIRQPQSAKHKLFAEHQEGARKDVECAFGILQSRFRILKQPARLWDQGDLENIMLACIILHNMVIEDERDIEEIPLDLNETPSTSTVQEATISQVQHNPEMEQVIERNAIIRDRTAHRQLQSDLIEHIWQKFGSSGVALLPDE